MVSRCRSRTTRAGTATYRSERSGNEIVRTYVDPSGATTVETSASDGSRALQPPDGTTDVIGAVASPVWGLAAPMLTPEVETRPGRCRCREPR